MLTPLEDPRYEPQHPPVDGEVPWVVEKWGPRSQLRWFDRFRRQLKPQWSAVWDRYYVSSTLHRGTCCDSCMEDQYEGWDDLSDGYCCCRAIRFAGGAD